MFKFAAQLSILFTIANMNLEGAVIQVPPRGDIQKAINVAADGDTIQLSAAIYKQPFHIVSKNLTIKGAGQDKTIIQAPNASTRLSMQQNFVFGADYFCVILVDNPHFKSQTVNISNLTVDGNNQQDCSSPMKYGLDDRFFAIGYHHAGGTISNVRTTSTRQYMGFDEPTGGGIIAASMVNSNTPIVFTVSNCLIDNYQWIGIDCRGKALTATISNNEIKRGYALPAGTKTAAPNGIQLSGSAKGSVTNNIISDNISTVEDEGGSAILLFDAGPDIIVTQNVIKNNDYGIVNINCSGNVNISDNTITSKIMPGGLHSGHNYGLFSKITVSYDSTFPESASPN